MCDLESAACFLDRPALGLVVCPPRVKYVDEYGVVHHRKCRVWTSWQQFRYEGHMCCVWVCRLLWMMMRIHSLVRHHCMDGCGVMQTRVSVPTCVFECSTLSGQTHPSHHAYCQWKVFQSNRLDYQEPSTQSVTGSAINCLHNFHATKQRGISQASHFRSVLK
jgi:hypothetical protein